MRTIREAILQLIKEILQLKEKNALERIDGICIFLLLRFELNGDENCQINNCCNLMKI